MSLMDYESPQARGAATFKRSLASRERRARKSDKAYPNSFIYLRVDARFKGWTRIGVSATPKKRFVRTRGTLHPVARSEQRLLFGIQVKNAYLWEQRTMVHFDSGGEEWIKASPRRVRLWLEEQLCAKMLPAKSLPC